MVLDRLRGRSSRCSSGQLRAPGRRRCAAGRRTAGRAHRRCASWPPASSARADGEVAYALEPLAWRTRSPCSPSGPRSAAAARSPTTRTRSGASSSSAARSTDCRWPSSSPRPGQGALGRRRSPAGWPTGSPCSNDPTSRGPVAHRTLGRRARLELRPAVPGRPARTLGAGVLRRRRAAGRGRVCARPRWACPTASAVDVVGRLVDRSLVTVESRPTARCATGCSTACGPSASTGSREAGRGPLRRGARGVVRRGGRPGRAGVRGPAPAATPRAGPAERANIDAALGLGGRHDPLLGLRIANGFGWAWVVLGDGVDGARRVRPALSAAGVAGLGPGPGDRAAAGRVAGGVGGQPGSGDAPRGGRQGNRRARPA